MTGILILDMVLIAYIVLSLMGLYAITKKDLKPGSTLWDVQELTKQKYIENIRVCKESGISTLTLQGFTIPIFIALLGFFSTAPIWCMAVSLILVEQVFTYNFIQKLKRELNEQENVL